MGDKNATLSSQGGCVISLQYPEMNHFDLDGGIVWAAANDTSDGSDFYISGNNASIHPPCSEDEFYITSVTKATPHGTIMVGEACKAPYFLGDSVVTASLSQFALLVKSSINLCYYIRREVLLVLDITI
ncbi:hypothetical protein F5X98DRAFT_360063 [Xylaria grammica]|nr:hypothetical protein F5X98DRAFT_360063 [Xylaria grammica]